MPAIRQHEEILAGICSHDPVKARLTMPSRSANAR